MALALDTKSEAAKMLREDRADGVAALRLSFFTHLTCYVSGIVVFTGISLGIGNGTFVMKWPLIWWTVAVTGHGLTVAIVELVARHERLERA